MNTFSTQNTGFWKKKETQQLIKISKRGVLKCTGRLETTSFPGLFPIWWWKRGWVGKNRDKRSGWTLICHSRVEHFNCTKNCSTKE